MTCAYLGDVGLGNNREVKKGRIRGQFGVADDIRSANAIWLFQLMRPNELVKNLLSALDSKLAANVPKILETGCEHR